MSLVRLTWQQQGIYDNFEVYRSNAPIDPGNLPSPYATGINLTTYDDVDVASNTVYYYRVGVRRFEKFAISQQVAIATTASGFVKNVELLFENNFIDTQGNSTWVSTQVQSPGTDDVVFNTNAASGTYAAYFGPLGGTGRSIYSNTEQLNFGTGNFTLNMDVNREYTDASGTYSELLNTGASTAVAGDLSWSFHATGHIGLEWWNGTSNTWVWAVENKSDARLNLYYNIKLNKVGPYIEQFVNDVLVDRGYMPFNVNFNRVNKVTMGSANWGSQNRWCGNIDNFYSVRGTNEPLKNRHHPDMYMPMKSNMANLGRQGRLWMIGGSNVTWETLVGRQCASFANGYYILSNADGSYESVGQELTLKPCVVEFDFLVKNLDSDVGYSCLISDRRGSFAGVLMIYHQQWVDKGSKIGFKWSGATGGLDDPNLVLDKVITPMTWYTLRIVNEDMASLKFFIDDESVGEITIDTNQFWLAQIGRESWTSTLSRAAITNFKITTPATEVPPTDYNPNLMCNLPLKDSGRSYLIRDLTGRTVWSGVGLDRSNFGIRNGVDCVTLNGVDEYITIKDEAQMSTGVDDYILQFRVFIPVGTPSNKVIFGSNNGVHMLRYLGGSTLNVTLNNSGVNAGGLTEGQWNTVTIQRAGIRNNIIINNIVQSFMNFNGVVNWCAGGSGHIGWNSPFGYTSMSIAEFKFARGTSDLSLLIDDATTSYENMVLGTRPLVYYPMDNAAAGTVVNLVHVTDNQGTFGGGGITYRQKVLREGHAGAIGFDVDTPGSAQVYVNGGITTDFQQLPLTSHAWCCWVHKTDNTTYNSLFANWNDPVSGTADFRVISGMYQFPENDKSITVPGLNTDVDTTMFIAVVYDTVAGTYRCFVNGTWTTGAYIAPEGLRYNSTTFQFPGSATYDYYGIRGYMSDLVFWKYAPTESYIERLYAKGQFKALTKAQLSAEFMYVDEVGNSFVSLTWTQGGSYENFDILRSEAEFGTYTPIVSNTALLTYSDHSITMSKTYWYKILTRRGEETIESDPLMCDTYSRFILNFSDPLGNPDPHDVELNFKRKL